MIVHTHPNNRKVLKEDLPDFAGVPADVFGGDLFGGIQVVFNEHMPERRIETRWKPPPAERFVEYELSDEAWMRPLGIGVYEEDCGPLFMAVPEGRLWHPFPLTTVRPPMFPSITPSWF